MGTAAEPARLDGKWCAVRSPPVLGTPKISGPLVTPRPGPFLFIASPWRPASNRPRLWVSASHLRRHVVLDPATAPTRSSVAAAGSLNLSTVSYKSLDNLISWATNERARIVCVTSQTAAHPRRVPIGHNMNDDTEPPAAERWRALSEDAYAVAEGMTDQEAKRIMHQIAFCYDGATSCA